MMIISQSWLLVSCKLRKCAVGMRNSITDIINYTTLTEIKNCTMHSAKKFPSYQNSDVFLGSVHHKFARKKKKRKKIKNFSKK